MTDDELQALLTKPTTHADDCPVKILDDMIDAVLEPIAPPEGSNSPVVTPGERRCWICRHTPCEPSCPVQRQGNKRKMK